MSSKRLKSKARRIAFEAQQADEEKARYGNRVAKTANDIVAALSLEHNRGELYAYDYEILLLMLGYDIKLGADARSIRQHEEDRRDFARGTLDAQVSAAETHRQMEARRLMHDAVSFAISEQMIVTLPPQEDGMVALHLTVEQLNAFKTEHHREQTESTEDEESARWTVHFVDKEPLPDYAYLQAPHLHIRQAPKNPLFTSVDAEDDISVLSGRQASLTRGWGQ